MYSQPRGYYTGSSVSRPTVQYSRPSAPTPVGGTSPPVQRYQDPYNAPGSRPAPSPQPYAQFQAQPMSYQAGQSQYQRPFQPQQDNRYMEAQSLQYSRDLAARAERDKERDRIERNSTPGGGSVGAGRPMVPQVRHSVAVPTSAGYGGSAPPAQSSVVYNSSVPAPKKPSPGMGSTDASQVSGSGPVSSAVPRASGVTSATIQAGVATADNGSVGASSFEQRAADFLARRQQIYQRQHEATATAPPPQPIQQTQPPQQQDENQNKMRLEEQLRKNIAAADRERELERAEMARKLEQTAERARERELALQRRQEEEREQGRRQLQQHFRDQENARLESERRTKEYEDRKSRERERAEGGRQEQQSAQGRQEGPRQQQMQERAEAQRAEKEQQTRERQNRERQESERQAREKQEAERHRMAMEKERQVLIVLARASLWLHILNFCSPGAYWMCVCVCACVCVCVCDAAQEEAARQARMKEQERLERILLSKQQDLREKEKEPRLEEQQGQEARVARERQQQELIQQRSQLLTPSSQLADRPLSRSNLLSPSAHRERERDRPQSRSLVDRPPSAGQAAPSVGIGMQLAVHPHLPGPQDLATV